MRWENIQARGFGSTKFLNPMSRHRIAIPALVADCERWISVYDIHPGLSTYTLGKPNVTCLKISSVADNDALAARILSAAAKYAAA